MYIHIHIKYILYIKHIGCFFTPRYSNTEFVSSRFSLTSWGEVASLNMVDHPPGYVVTIKIPHGADQLCTPSFPIGLVKTESDFIVDQLRLAYGDKRW